MTLYQILSAIAVVVLFFLLYRIGSKVDALSGWGKADALSGQGRQASETKFIVIRGDSYSPPPRWVNPGTVTHFEPATGEGGTWINFVGGTRVLVTIKPEEIVRLLDE